MTFELQLQIEIFRLMLHERRREARAMRAFSREMRKQAAAMRVSTRAEVAEKLKCLLTAQPIATMQ